MHVAWDRWIADRPWVLKRQDDNGNRFVVSRYLTREEADAAAAEFDARGHKQLYWVEEDRRDRTERD
ncbi:MAG: SPOR domain-containing protein [Actinomycetota bacterium]|nr:SPOR domain-containing protein [Actinomycetota bacterium]